jgi:alkylation response protein AidB-like acyl-CoA dehydrogenase/predicted heme/steroid binding protein
MKSIPLSEFQSNNGQNNKPLWISIDGIVMDITKFASFHPGGRAILDQVAGKDASQAFRLYHAPRILEKYKDKFTIGVLQDDFKKIQDKQEIKQQQRNMVFSPDAFGDQIPYSDPAWYQRQPTSPFYKESHVQLRSELRTFVDEYIIKTMDSWKSNSIPPKSLMLEMGRRGYLAMMAGGPPSSEFMDYIEPETAKLIPKDFDFFHVIILYDEISRCGDSGIISALTNGTSIACSAIIKQGSEEVKRKILPQVLMGRRYISLGVTEPAAGSDVAGLTLELIENPIRNDSFIVRGTKKFITNGMYCDYCTILCKDKSKGGLTMCVVQTRDDEGEPVEGFTPKKLSIKGTAISGTALLDFYNVPVLKSHILGERGQGFKLQMKSFNFERFYVVVCMQRLSRILVSECIKQCLTRTTFGKKLSSHQAVRMRLAEMIRDVESLQAWMESIAFQMGVYQHDPDRAAFALGEVIGSLKVQASYVYQRCEKHATHIFGGLSLQENSRGELVELATGQVKGYLIPAGAADILDDFTVRKALGMAERLANL